jgi:hypothetical protein
MTGRSQFMSFRQIEQFDRMSSVETLAQRNWRLAVPDRH